MNIEDITFDQWTTKISEKTGKPNTDIINLFNKNRIAIRQTKPIPRRLLINSLSFNGVKKGEFETNQIQFSVGELSPGLHAIVSVENLKGKSTILKIMRWLLTGIYDLPADMNGWLQSANLGFQIDDVKYELEVESVVPPRGFLRSLARGKIRIVGDFSDADGFRSLMDSFFLAELKLEPLIAVADKNEVAIEQRHGWNWLFGATVIEPAPTVLFGSDVQHGKPGRMLQMYLGIPWVLTRSDLMAAKKRLEIGSRMAAIVSKEALNAAEKRLVELRSERSQLQSKIKDGETITDLRQKLSETFAKYMQAGSDVRRLSISVNEAEEELEAAIEAQSAAIRRLREYQETVAAGKVFRKLRPVCCPSCEELYTDNDRAERESKHDCLVCGRDEKRASEEGPEVEVDLSTMVEEAKAERQRRSKFLGAAKAKFEEARSRRDVADQLSESLERQIISLQQNSGADLQLIKLDAQIEELERLHGEDTIQNNDDIKILQSAIDLTEKLYSDKQAEILETVSQEITKFAQSFGMSDLVEVKLKGNANMDVFTKGGKKSFGGCEPGERVRLKVAATLALIQVSEQRGIGNHPGLLFLDSIRNNEVTDDNVAEIVKGLRGLGDTLPEVQIFISGISSSAILDNVPCKNVIQNRPDGYLW